MDDASLATELEELKKKLLDERLATSALQDRYRESTENVVALQTVLRRTLIDLEAMTTTLTEAQNAGSVATVRWQTLAAQLRDEHARLIGLLQALLDVRRMVRFEAPGGTPMRMYILSRLRNIETPESVGLLLDEERRQLAGWSACKDRILCGYPDGKSGVTCKTEARFVRIEGPFLYSCEEHAR
jgi:hypothetical protein